MSEYLQYYAAEIAEIIEKCNANESKFTTNMQEQTGKENDPTQPNPWATK